MILKQLRFKTTFSLLCYTQRQEVTPGRCILDPNKVGAERVITSMKSII